MSFDPFNQQPPRDPDRPSGPVPGDPGAYRPESSAQPTLSGYNVAPGATPVSFTLARERILFPAVLILVSGILNLLFGGLMGLQGLPVMLMSQEQFREAMLSDPRNAKNLEMLEREGYGIKQIQSWVGIATVGTMGLNVVTSLLILFAGVRMLQLRNYGFVFFSSLLAAIPCVSGSGCCCVGQVAGLWAIIMLLQPDIRDAFR